MAFCLASSVFLALANFIPSISVPWVTSGNPSDLDFPLSALAVGAMACPSSFPVAFPVESFSSCFDCWCWPIFSSDKRTGGGYGGKCKVTLRSRKVHVQRVDFWVSEDYLRLDFIA